MGTDLQRNVIQFLTPGEALRWLTTLKVKRFRFGLMMDRVFTLDLSGADIRSDNGKQQDAQQRYLARIADWIHSVRFRNTPSLFDAQLLGHIATYPKLRCIDFSNCMHTVYSPDYAEEWANIPWSRVETFRHLTDVPPLVHVVFRELPFHATSPIRLPKLKVLELGLTCEAPADPPLLSVDLLLARMEIGSLQVLSLHGAWAWSSETLDMLVEHATNLHDLSLIHHVNLDPNTAPRISPEWPNRIISRLGRLTLGIEFHQWAETHRSFHLTWVRRVNSTAFELLAKGMRHPLVYDVIAKTKAESVDLSRLFIDYATTMMEVLGQLQLSRHVTSLQVNARDMYTEQVATAILRDARRKWPQVTHFGLSSVFSREFMWEVDLLPRSEDVKEPIETKLKVGISATTMARNVERCVMLMDQVQKNGLKLVSFQFTLQGEPNQKQWDTKLIDAIEAAHVQSVSIGTAEEYEYTSEDVPLDLRSRWINLLPKLTKFQTTLGNVKLNWKPKTIPSLAGQLRDFSANTETTLTASRLLVALKGLHHLLLSCSDEEGEGTRIEMDSKLLSAFCRGNPDLTTLYLNIKDNLLTPGNLFAVGLEMKRLTLLDLTVYSNQIVYEDIQVIRSVCPKLTTAVIRLGEYDDANPKEAVVWTSQFDKTHPWPLEGWTLTDSEDQDVTNVLESKVLYVRVPPPSSMSSMSLEPTLSTAAGGEGKQAIKEWQGTGQEADDFIDDYLIKTAIHDAVAPREQTEFRLALLRLAPFTSSWPFQLEYSFHASPVPTHVFKVSRDDAHRAQVIRKELEKFVSTDERLVVRFSLWPSRAKNGNYPTFE